MPSRATSTASLLLALFAMLFAVLAGCAEETPPERPSFEGTIDPQLPPVRIVEAGVELVDVTDESGIDFRHFSGATGKKWLPETMGSGVGLFDYDGDGDLDALFIQGMAWDGDASRPSMKLYRNDGDWTFVDATEGSGLEVPCYGMGCTIADYDADGDPDVFVTARGPDLLFRNEGGGKFTRVKDAPGDDGWTTGAAWFDADADGDLDLILVSYVKWSPETDVHAEVVAGIKAYTRPENYEGDQPRLFLQQDDGSFRDATKASGLTDTREKGKSMAVCLDDFDGDGSVDIFVANDTVQNFLFLNRGDARFEEVAVEAGVAYDDRGRARAGMGMDAVDWRNDGQLAVAIGNFSEEMVSLYSVARSKPLLFRDDASTARIGTATLMPLTFGVVMADVDLDGWCDMVLANGHIEPSVTKLKKELSFPQTPQLFRNVEGKRFADVSRVAGPGLSRQIVGRGLAAGDLDGDGDLDIVLTGNAGGAGGRPLVLRNDLQTDNRSLRLTLRQPGTKNPEALGAIVHATAGGVTQRRVVRTGGSYLSQGELTLTFGLGEHDAADVEITWPDGTVEKRGKLRAGTHEIARDAK